MPADFELRPDIVTLAMKTPTPRSAYARAGVDIDAQEKGLARVKKLAKSTFTPGVLSEIGSFGGLFRPDLSGHDRAGPRGLRRRRRHQAGGGADGGRLLHRRPRPRQPLRQRHPGPGGASRCSSSTTSARASSSRRRWSSWSSGVADGCRENGCALLGGETAEMPGFYQPGDYELVGFIVGLVDRPKVLDGSRVRPGDVLVGLPSSGLHTNGYSLARRILFDKLGLGDRATGALEHEADGGRGAAGSPPLLSRSRSGRCSATRPSTAWPTSPAAASPTTCRASCPTDTHALIRIGSWPVPEPLPLPPGEGGGRDARRCSASSTWGSA